MVNRSWIVLFLSLSVACKDQQLTIKKNSVEQNRSTIKLEGFYWTKATDINQIDWWYDTFFLYENSVLIYGGGIENYHKKSVSFSEFVKRNRDTAFKQKIKSSWGIYMIDENRIEFEKWEPSSGGPMKTVIRRGHILNDTTFVITERFNHYDGKTYHVQDTFRFREFSPKPDSTNRFIK